MFLLFLSLAGVKPEAAADDVATAIVQTLSGPVSGTASFDDSIEVFKGIPYAAPPIGELRWRPPEPADTWTEVRVCDRFGPRSLQRNNRPGQSEDC